MGLFFSVTPFVPNIPSKEIKNSKEEDVSMFRTNSSKKFQPAMVNIEDLVPKIIYSGRSGVINRSPPIRRAEPVDKEGSTASTPLALNQGGFSILMDAMIE
jgi:hypothetical protein